LKTQAIYGLPIQLDTFLLSCVYFVAYTSILLFLAVWTFSRRELV